MHCIHIVIQAEIASKTFTGTFPVTGSVNLPVILQCSDHTTQGGQICRKKIGRGTLDLELTLNSYSGAPKGPRASPERLLSLQRNVTNVLAQGAGEYTRMHMHMHMYMHGFDGVGVPGLDQDPVCRGYCVASGVFPLYKKKNFFTGARCCFRHFVSRGPA